MGYPAEQAAADREPCWLCWHESATAKVAADCSLSGELRTFGDAKELLGAIEAFIEGELKEEGPGHGRWCGCEACTAKECVGHAYKMLESYLKHTHAPEAGSDKRQRT
jgi:hypothetical protein